MRFVDMFMTALGSLIFITLLLVFLLPKAAQPVSSAPQTDSIPKLRKERDDALHLLKNVKEVDKHVVKRWFSILLLTKDCPPLEPMLYARWEGTVSDFTTGATSGEMAKFDAGDPAVHHLLGRRYVFAGPNFRKSHSSRAFLTAPTALLEGTGLAATTYFSVNNAPGPWSIYIALRDPRALREKECIVHPLITGWAGEAVETTLTLSLAQPFAWVRRLRVEQEGDFKSAEPRSDLDFRRELEAFSSEQSRNLCEKKSICDTRDAHWATLAPAPATGAPPASSAMKWTSGTMFVPAGYSYQNNLTETACAKACLDDSRCEQVEYASNTRLCILHERSGAIPTVQHASWSIGVKTRAEPLLVRWRRDHVAEGEASAEKAGMSREQCARACADDFDCEAVEYFKPTGVCRLYETAPKISASPHGAHSAFDVGTKLQPRPAKRR